MSSLPIGRAASAPRAKEKRKKEITFQPGPPQWRPRTGPGQAPDRPRAGPGAIRVAQWRVRPRAPHSIVWPEKSRSRPPGGKKKRKKGKSLLAGGPFFSGRFFLHFFSFPPRSASDPRGGEPRRSCGARPPATRARRERSRRRAPNRRGGGAPGRGRSVGAAHGRGPPPPAALNPGPEGTPSPKVLQGRGALGSVPISPRGWHAAPVLGLPGRPAVPGRPPAGGGCRRARGGVPSACSAPPRGPSRRAPPWPSGAGGAGRPRERGGPPDGASSGPPRRGGGRGGRGPHPGGRDHNSLPRPNPLSRPL